MGKTKAVAISTCVDRSRISSPSWAQRMWLGPKMIWVKAHAQRRHLTEKSAKSPVLHPIQFFIPATFGFQPRAQSSSFRPGPCGWQQPAAPAEALHWQTMLHPSPNHVTKVMRSRCFSRCTWWPSKLGRFSAPDFPHRQRVVRKSISIDFSPLTS